MFFKILSPTIQKGDVFTIETLNYVQLIDLNQ